MSKPRITKLVCPSCEGTGQFRGGLSINCMWCRGEKRLPVTDALRYADIEWNFAGGGYIAGDYSFDEMVKQERKAERIYDIAGIPTPWVRR